jgi:hypothetical protein
MVNARTSGDGRAGESKGANPQSSAASASSNLWMPAGLAQPAPVPSRRRSDHAAINKRVKEQIKKTRQRLYRSNGNWAVAWILHEDLVSQHGKDKALDEWSGSCFTLELKDIVVDRQRQTLTKAEAFQAWLTAGRSWHDCDAAWRATRDAGQMREVETAWREDKRAWLVAQHEAAENR